MNQLSENEDKLGAELEDIFDSFDENKIFNKKEYLQSGYTPSTVPHREEHIKQIAAILGSVLRGERPSNLFLYGNTGTGKTLSVLKVKEALEARMKKRTNNNFDLKIVYLNCKMGQAASTEYRIIAELIKLFGEEVPPTGLPTHEVHNRFRKLLDSKKQLVVLILDEIDQLVSKMSDNFLYNLTRLNTDLKRAKVSFVGISNNLTFLDNIDSRVKSSLGEEQLIFDPYKADQILDILSGRVKYAFKENVLEPGVIQKCAAYAVRDSGDARKALELIRIAGELAERSGDEKVRMQHVDKAKDKIESDRILDVINGLNESFKLVLGSIIFLSEQRRGAPFFTGDVYNHYSEMCKKLNREKLSQRRVGDMIREFDMFGIINFRVVSKGRGGRTSEIKLVLDGQVLENVKKLIQDSIF